jgi:hypothetical protein
MDALGETRIELSRTKILLLTLASLAFVALGFWLFSLSPEFIATEFPYRNAMFIHGIGLVSILFFGLTAIFAFKKLFDKRPGLVLNSSGIVDNTSAIAAGFIPWMDISGAEIHEIRRQKLLIIKLKEPQRYIERGSNLRQTLNKANYKMCGSPVAITSNGLKVGFAELLSIFNEYHKKYGQP